MGFEKQHIKNENRNRINMVRSFVSLPRYLINLDTEKIKSISPAQPHFIRISPSPLTVNILEYFGIDLLAASMSYP